jgi:4-oxalocrotonate tautomerase
VITRCVTRAGGEMPLIHRSEKEQRIPLINVKLIEGVFSSEQKTQIIERLTDAMVSIEGENMRQVTWCVVEEVKSGDWGIAGQSLTTEAIQQLAAGAPTAVA